MAESVYKIIELVGTSSESWEKAAAAAVNKASKTLRDLRVAEISQRGIEPAKRETYDNGVTKVIYRDPEGNEISLGGAPS